MSEKKMNDRLVDDPFETYTGPRLFGAPVGDFTAFQTVLFTLAVSVATFFFTTFLAIIGLLIYSSFAHHMVDFSLSYRRVGLPAGLIMVLVSGLYLGSLFIRRVTANR